MDFFLRSYYHQNKDAPKYGWVRRICARMGHISQGTMGEMTTFGLRTECKR
jgi:hypothetical protein